MTQQREEDVTDELAGRAAPADPKESGPKSGGDVERGTDSGGDVESDQD